MAENRPLEPHAQCKNGIKTVIRGNYLGHGVRGIGRLILVGIVCSGVVVIRVGYKALPGHGPVTEGNVGEESTTGKTKTCRHGMLHKGSALLGGKGINHEVIQAVLRVVFPLEDIMLCTGSKAITGPHCHTRQHVHLQTGPERVAEAQDVPDVGIDANTLINQCLGFKQMDFPLPTEILGHDKVYIRLHPVSKAAGSGYDYDESTIKQSGNGNAISYFAIRYNK